MRHMRVCIYGGTDLQGDSDRRRRRVKGLLVRLEDIRDKRVIDCEECQCLDFEAVG